MAKYVTKLLYTFKPVEDDGASGSSEESVVYHDSYEEAVAFQNAVINPGYQTMLAAMTAAGGQVASNPGQAKKV